MLHRLPKKYRNKYNKKLRWDEEVLHFAVKVIGSAALFFLFAIGADAYKMFH